ncbi:MAG: porin family protein [Gammaproteobacteria bacterium]|nr:porin family protein [Gammaproteobacteria bacterium]NND60233.1 porin family protein [Gammaproteobacteria bacterium]
MRTVIPLTLLCLSSGTAMAVNETNLYGAVGGGIHRIESQGFDDTAPTIRMIGGYRFNDIIAVEAGYTRLFDTSDTVEGVRVKIDGNSWELGTKLSYPINQRYNGYGRIGWSFYEFDAKVFDQDLALITADEDGDAFTWALGGRVRITERMDINGEYARILVDNADVDFLSLDLAYRFGTK